MELLTRDEMAARARELKESIAAQAVAYPGEMPVEAQARWDTDNKEVEQLERDVRAWDARQARLTQLGEGMSTEAGNSPPLGSSLRYVTNNAHAFVAVASVRVRSDRRSSDLQRGSIAVDSVPTGHDDAARTFL